MTLQKDKLVIQELAKKYNEIANNPINKARENRMRKNNGLVPGRPILWIHELPWNEMDIDGQLRLACESPFAQGIEWFLRTNLFRWKYFQADMIAEDAYYIYKSFSQSDMGLEVREDIIATDDANYIVSHAYKDELDTEEKLESLVAPIITAHPEEDEKNIAMASELLGDTLPVRLRGHGIYYAPWDTISRYRGVEPIMIDIMERPDFIHKIIAKFTEFGLLTYDQMEAQGLLDYNIADSHCTPPYCDELPASDFDGVHVRLKDIWFRGMAQLFSSISPAAHNEFDIEYMRLLMDKCALSYYGCCEPLDHVIPYLKRIKNMRKIGVSPWANVRSSAEQIGGDYVFARKPNPAMVAGTLDEDAIKREISETIEVCIENKCPYEFVLKDISTVGYKPQNLIKWHDIAMQTIDNYY